MLKTGYLLQVEARVMRVDQNSKIAGNELKDTKSLRIAESNNSLVMIFL